MGVAPATLTFRRQLRRHIEEKLNSVLKMYLIGPLDSGIKPAFIIHTDGAHPAATFLVRSTTTFLA